MVGNGLRVVLAEDDLLLREGLASLLERSGFQVTLADGKQYPARLVGGFPADDLAVLHVNATGLHPASFADSADLAVGDVTLAIGNPLGLQSSVTEGIVSALGRTVNEDNGVALPNVIQTSAAINPGNSGGALVDLQGQVVGIPTLAAADPQLGGSAAGIGFAIPSNTVQDIADQLIGSGQVTNSHRAYLGVEVAATTSNGVLVTEVRQGGPAGKAGIATGELVTAVDGTATPDPASLADVLAGLHPGQAVRVAVMATGPAGRCGSPSASTPAEGPPGWRLQPAGIRRFRLPGSGKRVLAAMPPGPPSAILGGEAMVLTTQATRRWTSMRPWTRLQDFGALIAGLYAALSPIWVSTTGERGAYWALIALGVLLAVAALISLAMPGVVATEWLIVLFGVLLFVAPWVLSYTELNGASWTSWVVGVVAVILGGTAVPPSLRAHRQAIQH